MCRGNEAALTEHSPEHSSGKTAGENGEGTGEIRCGSVVHQPGKHDEQHKVEKSGREPPEETSGPDCLSSQDSACETGDDINDVDCHVDLTLLQLPFVERKGQYQQKNAGQQVGNDETAKHRFRFGWVHRCIPFQKTGLFQCIPGQTGIYCPKLERLRLNKVKTKEKIINIS